MIRRASILGFIAVLAALVLSACAGLPVSGPVRPGLAAGNDAGSPVFLFRPDEPQPGATPEQIVEGFIRAGSGPGPSGNWDVARMFLASSIRDSWTPEASVTIDLADDRQLNSPTEGVVDLAVAAVATVDENGAYQPADSSTTPLSFRLAQQDDGEWRITEAPDGIVIERDVFTNVFHRYSLMYFDPTWQFLVPDVRWFPTTNAPTRITDALVDGEPSAWLAESVSSAVPESVSLARPSVPIEDGIAQVALTGDALLADSTTLDRMQTQLASSLATASVPGAQMTVAGTPLTAEAISPRSTRITGPPVVLTADGFGFLSGDELTPIDGLSEAMLNVNPTAIQVAADRDFAAVRLADGSVARVPAEGGVTVVDTRAGLVDPGADPFGYIWSVPRSQPAQVTTFSATGQQFAVADAWLGASEILAMSLSRDGTRAAALVVAGGRSELWIAGIVRGTEAEPLRLGDPIVLGTQSTPGSNLAWLDDTTVGVLAMAPGGAEFTEQLVGGPASTFDAPVGAVSVAGATSISSVRLRGEDGSLYVKRAATWQRAGSGVLVLATQQGSPQ